MGGGDESPVRKDTQYEGDCPYEYALLRCQALQFAI
jgi:hypothetical protein